MEVNAPVWLRRSSSHWGWVPAIIYRKEEVTSSDGQNTELINLTLVPDMSVEGNNRNRNRNTSGSQYFSEEADFGEVSVQVDPEQLKTADHEDIKLRNLPNSFQVSGADPEAGVLASPSTHADTLVVGGVDDLIGLTHLHEPAILHALRLRYDSDIIYTATGPILIAVNPFKPMDLYSNQTMERYRLQGEQGVGNSSSSSSADTPFKSRRKKQVASASARLAPHVYQTADDAYRQMLRGLENKALMGKGKRGESGVLTQAAGAGAGAGAGSPTNQSILVSGESGAGKTVTTKIVLNYFAMLSKKRAEEELRRVSPSKSSPKNNSQEVSIEQQVLQSNPILEAFGNARTIRNDNSSRFGKYIDIAFNKTGKLSGASIETYLLEKVRLIHPSPGERNYHVFYQFLKAATAQQRQNFFIGNKSAREFRLLSDSGTYDRRDGVSDEDNHFEMLEAMVRTKNSGFYYSRKEGCLPSARLCSLTNVLNSFVSTQSFRLPLDSRPKRSNP
jgi:myosin heavy subunit